MYCDLNVCVRNYRKTTCTPTFRLRIASACTQSEPNILHSFFFQTAAHLIIVINHVWRTKDPNYDQISNIECKISISFVILILNQQITGN